MSLKSELLQKCIEQVEESITNTIEVINEAQKSANEYGIPRDRYDSYRAQLLRKKDMFAQQLERTRQQLDLLKRIDEKRKSESVEFGAIVKTEFQKMFISTGLGKVNLNGDTFYVISTLVPIYKAIEGKKVGEVCEFNGRKMKILEVE